MTRQYTDDGVGASEEAQSDAELITAVRGGDERAYATLWSRHEGAAGRLARQISNPSNADDLVSEAFLRVLRALKAGNGPDGAFRPYLFSTLRRINIDNGRSYYTRVALTDDERDLDLDPSESAAEVLAGNDEGSAAWRAWSSLPDSAKTLLWHLIIEEETPAQIAPLIGTTPNGVSSRAVRAKERLRQAFLQQHLLDADTDACRQARRRFGEYVRDALSTRDQSEVRAHLETCTSCQGALLEVSDINQTMKLVIGPAVLGGLLIAGHYAAASGVAGGAAKVSVLSHISHLGHALKNPVIATATVAASVAVAGVAAAAVYVVHSANASDSTPSAAAAAPPLAGSTTARASAPAVVPLSSPTNVSPSPTPTPTTSTSPTPTPTPSKAKTTAKTTPRTTAKSTAGIVVAASVPTTTTSPVVPPPPSTPPSYVQSPISEFQTAAPISAGMAFLVPSDWVITAIHIDEPVGDSITCIIGLFGNSEPDRGATCSGNAPVAGDQEYTLTVAPKSNSVPPDPGGVIMYSYSDVNNTMPSPQTVPITTS
jgi:RNA polymerase sigma factor (sigma-70 family)